MSNPPKRYALAEIEAALATLEVTRKPDGTPNWTRAAKESGVSVNTLKKWHNSADSIGVNDELVTTIKAELRGSFLEQIREVREAASRRMLQLIPEETDLHKVAGALKIANDAARLESGEATQRSEVRTVDEDPERQRLARAAAEALEREWEARTPLN